MIKKLLKEKEFGTVFEGIKVAGVTEYQKTPALSPNVPPQLYDLTGVWEGQMKQNGQVYDVKLDLSHKEPDLTGTMIVCYASSGGAIVVQQSMKGMVIKDNVKLYGVSYTYVRQGASHKYAMDSFSGKILNGGNTISGTSMDESGNKGEFSLTRLLEPESKKG
jgi:hypothetical protein